MPCAAYRLRRFHPPHAGHRYTNVPGNEPAGCPEPHRTHTFTQVSSAAGPALPNQKLHP